MASRQAAARASARTASSSCGRDLGASASRRGSCGRRARRADQCARAAWHRPSRPAGPSTPTASTSNATSAGTSSTTASTARARRGSSGRRRSPPPHPRRTSADACRPGPAAIASSADELPVDHARSPGRGAWLEAAPASSGADRTRGPGPRRRCDRWASGRRPQPVGHRADLVVSLDEAQRLGLGGAEEQPGQLVGSGPVPGVGRHGQRQRGDQRLGPLAGPADRRTARGAGRAAPAPCRTGTATRAPRARRRRMPASGRRRAAPRARRSRRCPTPRVTTSPTTWPRPRSPSTGLPSRSSSTLPGDTSPCTTPRSCNRPSADATGASTVTTSPGDRCPRARTSASSAPPSRCGITRATRPSGSSTQASTATTWALAAAADTAASRAAASTSAASACTTLTATRRPSSRATPAHTSLVPPRASSAPSSWPGTAGPGPTGARALHRQVRAPASSRHPPRRP